MSTPDPVDRDRLLALAREHGKPTAADREHVRAGVDARLLQPAAPSPVAAVGPKILVAVLVAVAAAVTVWVAGRRAPERATEPVVAAEAPEKKADPPTFVAAPPVAAEAPVPPVVTVAPRRERARADAKAASSLAEELRLLARARSALGAGAKQEARDLLEDHAKRFPSGFLAEERELLRFDTLCGLGLADDAAALARAFLAAYPATSHADRLRSCP